ncbi:MAG: fluoride efflux transporter CrcB [Bacteroidetes bacterium]|nr:fluoride efflux transporter CrcB [Bacteroidota bacterium]
MKELLLAGLGGMAGSMLRYVIGVAAIRQFNNPFPTGTFIINSVGCLLIGIIMALSEKAGWLPREYRVLLTVGFCGGFTTFSAFAWENIKLIQNGSWTVAAAYIFFSVLSGLLLTWGGYQLSKHIL